MCKCIEQMDRALETRNVRIATGLEIRNGVGIVRIRIGLEKIDKKKNKPIPFVMPSFCPFCGEKQI